MAAVPAVSNSCSVTITGENITNTAIQNAIDDAEAHVTGPVICISSGTYPEQLVINASGITLKGLGTMSSPSLIQPVDPIVPTSVSPDSGYNEYNIILVHGIHSTVSSVTITNLVVNGSQVQTTFSSCADPAMPSQGFDYEGILFLNASGTISESTVANILLPPGLAGCQPGDGILVQTPASFDSTVVVKDDKVLNYNKNGITCNDAGTVCTITKNTVKFYSPYSQYIAPNGIQVAYGAYAKVTGNTVDDNRCTLPQPTCGPDVINNYAGSGILTYGAAPGTTVVSNTLNNNDIGILLADDSTTVNSNTITNSNITAILQQDGESIYKSAKNHLASNPVGFIIVSDGCGGYPLTYTSNIKKTNSFGSDSPRIEIMTFSALPKYGCTGDGSVTVHYGSSTYMVSGNSTVYIG
jgi:parallel beta-helix repeat protein